MWGEGECGEGVPASVQRECEQHPEARPGGGVRRP